MILSRLKSLIIIAALVGAVPAAAQPFGAWLVKGSGAAAHSYVEIPANGAFNFTTGFTVEAWVSGTDTGTCSSIAGKDWLPA